MAAAVLFWRVWETAQQACPARADLVTATPRPQKGSLFAIIAIWQSFLSMPWADEAEQGGVHIIWRSQAIEDDIYDYGNYIHFVFSKTLHTFSLNRQMSATRVMK